MHTLGTEAILALLVLGDLVAGVLRATGAIGVAGLGDVNLQHCREKDEADDGCRRRAIENRRDFQPNPLTQGLR
jgi:hypothetical protein